MSSISTGTTTTTGYVVASDTTGALVLKTGASATTAVTVGSDQSVTFVGSQTLSGGTANGVTYLNGSKVLTSGSALTFDGSSLGVGTASPSGRLHVANTGTAGTTADNLAVYFSSANRNSNVYILAKNTEGSNLNFGDGDSSTVGRISYDHASNYMAFDANGSEQMRLTTTGLGIGTTSPTTKLSITDSTGPIVRLVRTSNRFELSADTDFMSLNARDASTYITFKTADTERARIDSSGNLLVGSTANDWGSYGGISQFRKDQNSASLLAISNQNSGSSGSAGILFAAFGNSWVQSIGTSAKNGNALTWALDASSSPPSEKMRLDSSGNLLVGTTSTSSTSGTGLKITAGSSQADALSIVTGATTDGGLTTYQLYSTGASAYRFYVGAGGTIFATSVVITAISDQRLKENVRDIDTGLNSIMALKPRRFDWKEGKGQDKKDVAGFIAQEFETVFPECVGTSKAGEDGIEYKNINHETLIPTLVKAMQEQQAIIESLTQRITALEAS